jgi:hypothetical protein
MTLTRISLGLVLTFGVVACAGTPAPIKPVSTISNGIVFVTQVPLRDDFTTIASTFGNHLSNMQSVPRGGDLWIRYSDGSLKNLTKAAGYGMDGLQGTNAIAVRDPSPDWDGKKLIFSMVRPSSNMKNPPRTGSYMKSPTSSQAKPLSSPKYRTNLLTTMFRPFTVRMTELFSPQIVLEMATRICTHNVTSTRKRQWFLDCGVWILKQAI